MLDEPNNRAFNARVGEIDLLRFLAALMVVFFHYTFRGYAADGLSDIGFLEFAPITKYGFLGVELFFMISGFVILMTASSGSLRKFAISRIVRLYPAYWLACTITFIAIVTLGRDRFSATISQYLINLTMLNAFIYVPSIDGAYWSLAVEIKFYLMITGLLLFRQIQLVERYLLIWIGVTLILELFPVETLQSICISRYAPFFIIGALSCLVYSNGWTKVRAVALGSAWLLALNSAVNSSKRYGLHYQTDYEPIAIVALVSLFVVVMILVSMRLTATIAGYAWIVKVGTLTYPLYLIHQNLGYMIFNSLGHLIDRHILLAGILLLMLLAARAMHTRVERPISARMKLWLTQYLLGKR